MFKKRKMEKSTKKIIYKGKEKEIPSQNPDPKLCEFYIIGKFRYCRFEKVKDSQFCIYHIPNENEEFLICPYDPKHRILKSKYKNHLKTCNTLKAKKEYESNPWYSHNINHAKDEKKYLPNSDELNQMYNSKWEDFSSEEYANMLDKIIMTYNTVKGMYEKYVKDNNIEEYIKSLDNEVVKYSLSGININAEKDLKSTDQIVHSTKHSIQNKAISLCLLKSGIINKDLNYVIVEFGAGKGGLSKEINDLTNEAYINILLERQGMRNKKEAKSKTMLRYKTDIIDFDLNYIDNTDKLGDSLEKDIIEKIKKGFNIIGVAKHICGCAFDLSLSCLFNYSKFDNIKGLCMATCCHHICRAELLNHLDFFIEKLNLTVKEIIFLFKATSWIFGKINIKEKEIKHDEIFKKKNISRKHIGLISKYIVDLARSLLLIEKGFKVCYLKYCDNGITTENNLILAIKQ